MIKLIVGGRGSGKTKMLIDRINEAAATSKGSVVCLDKTLKLTYDIKNTVRLVDMDQYYVNSFDRFEGFVLGILAGNYDITDVFVDSILKVGGPEKDIEGFAVMCAQLDECLKDRDINLVFTVSIDKEKLPESLYKFI